MTHDEIRARLLARLGRIPNALLVVDIARQELSVVHNNAIVARYPVSTSRFGTGNAEGSYQTPRGLHRIREKIGDGAPVGRIFRDRLDTGEDWRGGEEGDNLILTRILRLEGLEEGVNRGPGIDSYERFIYLHGTNKERSIGTPMSHGCVCMRNSDIVQLYNATEEGTIVVID